MSINIGVNIQRSPNRINQALRAAGVNGQYPKLLFDFDDEYYLTGGSSKTFANAMTFARAGNATMVDSDGKIKWAPHNLLTYSEDYTAEKSSNNITLTSGVADPLGGTNAYTLTATAINGFFRGSSSITVVPQTTYTVAVFSKNVSGTIKIGAYDLTNGAPITSSELTNSTNEWALEFHEFTTPVGCTSVYVYAAQQTTNGASYDSFGFHTYRSDLGGMVNNPDRGDSYVPTTSSAVYLPRRGHYKYNGDQWVNKGLLVESEARTNLITYSNDFTQWTSSGTIETAGQAVGRDGNNSLSFIENNSGAAAAQTVTSFTLSASTSYNLSLDLKDAGDNSIQRIGLYDTVVSWHGYIEISWSSGVPSTSISSNANNVNYEDCGNGIYRVSLTITTQSTAGTTSFHIHPDRNGVIGAGIYVGFAQIEQASTPSSYIPTNGATVTRAAETVTVPYANLPWPTPTYIGDELVTNGTFDTDISGWTAANGGVLSVNNGAIRVTEDGVDGSTARAYQTITTEIGKVYLLSLDLVDTSDNFEVYVNTNPNYGGAIASSSTETDPQTLTLPFVATATTTYIIIGAGSPSTGIYSEYDNISVREINPLSVSIQMDGRVDFVDNDSFNTVENVRWLNNSTSEFIRLRIDSFFGTGNFRAVQKAGGVEDSSATATDFYSDGLRIPYNFAGRHGSTFVQGAVEGVALTANTTPTALPDLSSTDLSLGFVYMGTIKTFRIWDKDLGDTGIAAATAPSLEPSLSLSFDSTNSSFVDTGWSE